MEAYMISIGHFFIYSEKKKGIRFMRRIVKKSPIKILNADFFETHDENYLSIVLRSL